MLGCIAPPAPAHQVCHRLVPLLDGVHKVVGAVPVGPVGALLVLLSGQPDGIPAHPTPLGGSAVRVVRGMPDDPGNAHIARQQAQTPSFSQKTKTSPLPLICVRNGPLHTPQLLEGGEGRRGEGGGCRWQVAELA
jgi:hypothetical protein